MIELMTVVSILCGLSSTAMAPSFQDFIGWFSCARGLTYDLTADLLLARNEALKRNATITRHEQRRRLGLRAGRVQDPFRVNDRLIGSHN